METLTQVLNALIPVAIIAVCVALVVLLVELVKVVKKAHATMVELDPTIENVNSITTSLVPVAEKADPLVDRVQLTLDAVNLEMMRVDEILEDVSEITDTASSATNAVDTIASAPVKAVSNVATRVRTAFGSKSASEESAQLAEQRVAVAKALEDYKAAEQAGEKSEEPSVMDDLLKEASIKEVSVPAEDAVEEAAADAPSEPVEADEIFGAADETEPEAELEDSAAE